MLVVLRKEVSFMPLMSGIFVAMVTPFTDNQEIDYKRTAKLLNHLMASDIAGVFILGTNGEAYLLSAEEKIVFSSFVINYVNHHIKVLVGTGLNGTAETIDLSKRVAALEPDALSLVSPYFVAPSQDELIKHYEAVANAVKVPIMLYNMPGKTGINIEPESIAELSAHPNIIGIKDSSGKLQNLQGYLDKRRNKDFSVLVGSDSKILPFLKMGGDGAIAATANLLTKNDVNIYTAYQNGDLETAEKCQQNIEPLRSVLHGATTPVALKAAVTASGINVGPSRLPARMPAPSDKLSQDIANMVENYKAQAII